MSNEPTTTPPDTPEPWRHPTPGMPPWEQWPDETPKAYAAFCTYRDLGRKRSVVKAYRLQEGCERAAVSGRWNTWRSKYHWTKRAEAYDKELFRDLRAAEKEMDMELRRLRLSRRLHAHSANAAFVNQLMEQVTRALPGLTLVDEVTPLPGGGKMVRRGNSASNLARLLQQIRELESSVIHGFPSPNRYW
jgi:hypothetical protein